MLKDVKGRTAKDLCKERGNVSVKILPPPPTHNKQILRLQIRNAIKFYPNGNKVTGELLNNRMLLNYASVSLISFN